MWLFQDYYSYGLALAVYEAVDWFWFLVCLRWYRMEMYDGPSLTFYETIQNDADGSMDSTIS